MLKRVLGSLGLLSFASMTALLVGCPAPEPASPTPPPPPTPTAPSATAPASHDGPKGCSSNSDCGAGEHCAFAPGCGPGVCAPKQPCTMDLVPYCGCDGQVWKGSGTCPGRPYRSRGGCGAAGDSGPPVPGSKKACNSNADCGQGELCQGNEGCGAPWTCGPASPCTKDLVEWCGCDGQSFKGSGSCPGKPVKHKGKC